MAPLQAKLANAKRPLMIVGGPGWSVAAQKALEAFADRFDLPVAPAFRYQDYIDNRHRCYVGCAGIGIDAKLGAAVKEADLLIVLGARLGEMTTSRLHADRHPQPQAVPGAHPPLARRAGLGLPPRPADRRDGARRSPRRSAGLEAAGQDRLGAPARRAARRLRGRR